jgi:hypothetical protein
VARRTLRYVEALSTSRTPLAGFFSILLRKKNMARLHDSERYELSDAEKHLLSGWLGLWRNWDMIPIQFPMKV